MEIVEKVNCSPTCIIDGCKIEDYVPAVLVPLYILEDSVDALCCVVDECDRLDRCVDNGRDSFTRFVVELAMFVANEEIRSRLDLVLIVSQLVLDGSGDGAKGA